MNKQLIQKLCWQVFLGGNTWVMKCTTNASTGLCQLRVQCDAGNYPWAFQFSACSHRNFLSCCCSAHSYMQTSPTRFGVTAAARGLFIHYRARYSHLSTAQGASRVQGSEQLYTGSSFSTISVKSCGIWHLFN